MLRPARRWFDQWKRYTGCELGQLGDKKRIKLLPRSPDSATAAEVCRHAWHIQPAEYSGCVIAIAASSVFGPDHVLCGWSSHQC